MPGPVAALAGELPSADKLAAERHPNDDLGSAAGLLGRLGDGGLAAGRSGNRHRAGEQALEVAGTEVEDVLVGDVLYRRAAPGKVCPLSAVQPIESATTEYYQREKSHLLLGKVGPLPKGKGVTPCPKGCSALLRCWGPLV